MKFPFFRRRAARAYYFLHVPKTGGNTLTALFNRIFPAEEICPAASWLELAKVPREQLARYRLFRGHFFYYLRSYLQAELTIFTFLRDPIEHTLSHYEQILREPHHHYHQRARQLGSLSAALADPVIGGVVGDLQTRSLGLDLDPLRVVEELKREAINHYELARRLGVDLESEPARRALLGRALSRMRGMAFVGVMDHFEQSVRGLFQALGWRDPGQVPRENVSTNRIDRKGLTAEERRLLEERTRLDRALYDAALAHFKEQAARLDLRCSA
jgi:hypothetical protein